MTSNEPRELIEIRRLGSTAEAETCAQMMAMSEPWLTLQRDYTASLQIITDPLREVYVASCQGELVGFAILVMQGAFVAYLQSLCVAPAWRGRGIGRKLIAFVEERSFCETPNVFICVSSFNPDAQRLYIELGYEVIGELRDYVITGYSEILLRKTIAPLKGYKP